MPTGDVSPAIGVEALVEGPAPGSSAPAPDAGPQDTVGLQDGSDAASPASAASPEVVAPEPAAPSGGAAAAPTGRATAGHDDQLTRLREAWPSILDRLAASSRVAWTAFHAATPVSCSNGALAVAVAEPGNVRAIAQRGHDERLRQAIIDVLALDLTIDVLHDPEPARPAGATSPTTPTAGSARGGAADRTAAPGRVDPDPSAPGQAGSPAGPSHGPDPRSAANAADVVRAGMAAGQAPEAADEPSPDDPDLDEGGVHGLALITRELGARPIGEIDHS